MKIKLLVSACLLGEKCKYNGLDNYNSDVVSLKDKFDLIPICPECFGGLPTPREPSEIAGDRVITKSGEDVTEQFYDGAEKALYIARECNACVALLKENSPSCGYGSVYDGSFSRILVEGNGITAKLLSDNDIQVFGESNIDKLLYLYDD